MIKLVFIVLLVALAISLQISLVFGDCITDGKDANVVVINVLK